MNVGPSILAPMTLLDQPEFIDLEPVYNCNLRCRTCHVQQDAMTGEQIPLEAIARIGERPGLVCKVGTTHEPTTHSDFPALINILDQLGMGVALTTNGTLLTERLLDGIADYSVFRSVIFSFDGATKPLYEYLRVGAKFEQTVARIKAFIARLDRSKTKVYVNYTMVIANLHEVEAAIDLWEGVGVDGLNLLISSDRQNVDFLKDQMYVVAPERFQDAVERAAAHLIATDCRLGLCSPLTATPSFRERFGDHLFADSSVRARAPDPLPPGPEPDLYPGLCISPLREVRIRWNGNVYLCNSTFLVGNLRHASLDDIWTGPRATQARSMVATDNRYCLHCSYFHYCLSGRNDADLSAAFVSSERLKNMQETPPLLRED